MKKLSFLSVILFLSLTTDVLADTILFKSGLSVEGKVVTKTDIVTTVQKTDGTYESYMTDDVVSVVDNDLLNRNAQLKNSKMEAESLGLDKPPAGSIEIPVNPMIILNGKNRNEIMNLRRNYLNQMPTLAPKNYQPNREVFGRMGNGKPWWGVLGYDGYGPGKKSITGLSYYSQFILNPYLLAGVTTQAFVTKDAALLPGDLIPVPVQLIWEQGGSWGQVTYNLTPFYQVAEGIFGDANKLNLELINARDRGFKFFSIDSYQSSGINAAADKIIPLNQFIQTGGSCGYPGGCNFRSPSQPDLQVSFTGLPARIYIKLWKENVTDPTQESDMDFIIDLK